MSLRVQRYKLVAKVSEHSTMEKLFVDGQDAIQYYYYVCDTYPSVLEVQIWDLEKDEKLQIND